MVRTFSISLLLTLGLSTGYSQDNADPVAYLNIFNELHGEITNRNLEFLQYSVHSDDPAQVGEKRLALIAQLLDAVAQLEKIERFPSDAGMRSEMIGVLKTYLDVFKVDFEHVEKLLVNSQDSYQAMENYMEARERAESRLAEANDRFHAAAEEFAEANRIRLLRGEENSEIAQLNALSQYRDQIFLATFRIKKRNDEFRQAMDREDLAEMRTYRERLLEEAEQEVNNLLQLGDFHGNTNYRDAAISEIRGLAQLARDHYPAFITVKEKQGEGLEQADVDAYNAAVDAVNSLPTRLSRATAEARQELMRNNVPRPVLRGTKRI
jgi:hypothetical protein